MKKRNHGIRTGDKLNSTEKEFAWLHRNMNVFQHHLVWEQGCSREIVMIQSNIKLRPRENVAFCGEQECGFAGSNAAKKKEG